ncbi:MAG TPA: ABC transporter permease [Candidatus Limnocylindrales bacterium]|nr:ABC transporter permease [Candidatus Limnocylindrales bacterium]
MIRPRIIRALFRKDIVDGLRESRVLVSLLTPIVLAVMYNALFPEEKIFEAKVAYAGPENSAIVRTLVDRAQAGNSVSLKLQHVATLDDARRLVRSKDVDVAFVLPADIDDAIRAGRSPAIAVVQPETPGAAASFVQSSLQEGARTLAGQKPPAVVTSENVDTGGSADAGVMNEMGPRRYFVLATVVMMLGMISMLAVPIMLTEEAEKKTLDALLLVGSYLEVIVTKALVGLAYAALSVTLMLALTRMRPEGMLTFVAGTGLLALALIGVGLLIGGLFRSAQQVYSWSSIMLLPVIGPAFAVGLPVPDALDAVFKALPTSQGMRIMTNGLAGKPLFADEGVSFLIVGLWAAAAYGLLAWRLSRRES